MRRTNFIISWPAFELRILAKYVCRKHLAFLVCHHVANKPKTDRHPNLAVL